MGATVALIKNKEALYETAENLFNKGAEYCRTKLEEAKIANQSHFADTYQDKEFSTGRSTGSNLRDESDYDDISTPDTTDDDDLDNPQPDTVSLD